MKESHPPFLIIAGPCSIESKEQVQKVAKLLKEEGIFFLRGGIYKMRTQASSFQGLREKALPIVEEIKSMYNLSFVSEITDPRQMDVLYPVVDMFQVGARNMYNYELLKELGMQKKPVLLKRAFSAEVKEWLMATEYIVRGGNEEITLCERGIRTFEPSTRNTLDLSSALVAKKESSFPVLVDPSHGTGDASLVVPMAYAACAAGLDGLLVEVHPEPDKALSDGFQSLNFMAFKQMVKQLKKILSSINRPYVKKISDPLRSISITHA